MGKIHSNPREDCQDLGDATWEFPNEANPLLKAWRVAPPLHFGRACACSALPTAFTDPIDSHAADEQNEPDKVGGMDRRATR